MIAAAATAGAVMAVLMVVVGRRPCPRHHRPQHESFRLTKELQALLAGTTAEVAVAAVATAVVPALMVVFQKIRQACLRRRHQQQPPDLRATGLKERLLAGAEVAAPPTVPGAVLVVALPHSKSRGCLRRRPHQCIHLTDRFQAAQLLQGAVGAEAEPGPAAEAAAEPALAATAAAEAALVAEAAAEPAAAAGNAAVPAAATAKAVAAVATDAAVQPANAIEATQVPGMVPAWRVS